MPFATKILNNQKKYIENTKKSLGFGLLGAKLYELRKKTTVQTALLFLQRD